MATNDPITVAVNSKVSTKKVVALASVNNTLVVAGPRQIVGGELVNVAAYDVFLKFYDKATAPVAGTDIPVLTVKVPTGGALTPLTGIMDGMQFSNGIAYAITKLIAVTDTTVLAAGDVQGAILWR